MNLIMKIWKIVNKVKLTNNRKKKQRKRKGGTILKQRAQNPTGCKEENLIKNRERSKTICSLGLIFAFILLGIIIVTTMALAKYVIKDEKDIEVTLRNVRISENEI